MSATTMKAENDANAEKEDTSPGGSPLTDHALLEKIDKLFECNVGEYVSLPQLVVLGDQSCGKSSTLEALTGLSFPRDSGLCTRFATQIIFRRDRSLTRREITASIIPEADLDSLHVQRLQEWSASGLQTLTPEGFSQMMKEVHELMGLSERAGDGKPTFSKNVLRLQISGPEQDHLSVIDVPGLFKSTTAGRTTKQDIVLVRNMIEQYMNNPRSIMLTVVPANVDIATQEIIELAREKDPTGARTLSILTKPDLVDKGAEEKIIDLIEEENSSGKLGWVLIRNLGQEQLDAGNVDRNREEEMFHQQRPWNRVSKENYGIKVLIRRLREVLMANVRLAFPVVRTELFKRLNEAKKALASLGMERETVEQQRRVLIGVVSKFDTMTKNALSGNYRPSEVFDEQCLRLATLTTRRSIEFSDDLATYGHQYDFQVEGPEQAPPEPEPAPAEEDEDEGDDEEEGEWKILSRKVCDDGALQEILHVCQWVQSPQSGIHEWIEGEYNESRGFEIGVFNHTLLATLMQIQTKKWPVLALAYISDIVSIIHMFIVKALESICVNKKMADGIVSLLADELFSRYRAAVQHTEFLLRIEREGTPMTLNHYLNDNLETCRQKRFHSEMEGCTFTDKHNRRAVLLSDLMRHHPMSNSTHTVHDIHDVLQSYYKVARKRFVDAVWMQGADYHLVTGPKAPMNLLSPSWVNSLSNEQLGEVAGESLQIRRKRQQLRKQIADLEAGRKELL